MFCRSGTATDEMVKGAIPMTSPRITLLISALAVAFAALLGSFPAAADGPCPGMTISCENGHNYSFCPIAVSDAGGNCNRQAWRFAGTGGTHVRLVPMGVGYRYIGPGIWLDGVNSEAVLNFGREYRARWLVRFQPIEAARR